MALDSSRTVGSYTPDSCVFVYDSKESQVAVLDTRTLFASTFSEYFIAIHDVSGLRTVFVNFLCVKDTGISFYPKIFVKIEPVIEGKESDGYEFNFQLGLNRRTKFTESLDKLFDITITDANNRNQLPNRVNGYLNLRHKPKESESYKAYKKAYQFPNTTMVLPECFFKQFKIRDNDRKSFLEDVNKRVPIEENGSVSPAKEINGAGTRKQDDDQSSECSIFDKNENLRELYPEMHLKDRKWDAQTTTDILRIFPDINITVGNWDMHMPIEALTRSQSTPNIPVWHDAEEDQVSSADEHVVHDQVFHKNKMEEEALTLEASRDQHVDNIERSPGISGNESLDTVLLNKKQNNEDELNFSSSPPAVMHVNAESEEPIALLNSEKPIAPIRSRTNSFQSFLTEKNRTSFSCCASHHNLYAVSCDENLLKTAFAASDENQLPNPDDEVEYPQIYRGQADGTSTESLNINAGSGANPELLEKPSSPTPKPIVELPPADNPNISADYVHVERPTEQPAQAAAKKKSKCLIM